MKTKLIFAFSVFENCLDNRAIQIHLKCLRYYKDCFDETLFVFMGERKYSVPVIEQLIDIGFKKIQFKFRDIDDLWEAGVYYQEIAETDENDDKICFFAHTKGVSNYQKFNKDAIDTWITTLYFFNLCDYRAVKKWLITEYKPVFFGAYLNKDKENTFFNHWFYAGSFYWVNIKHLKTYTEKLPPLSDRWWSEMLPSCIHPLHLSSFAAVRREDRPYALYNDTNDYLSLFKEISNKQVYDDYTDFMKNINIKAKIKI